MKIVAIGRNYSEHIKELGNETPEDPIIFLKPDSAILRNNDAFYIPEFSNNVHYEVELIVRISKPGRYIQAKFADKYYDAIGLGIDFTARDIQTNLKEKGLPWDIAKGFNGSAPISKFVPLEKYEEIHELDFSLEKNGELVQKGNSKQMIHSIDEIIAYVSKFFTLKKGDIIFTGTPSGVGKVSIGDHLVGKIEGEEFLNFEIK